MLLVGGESHKVGQADEARALREARGVGARALGRARGRLPLVDAGHMPVDGVPFIGKLNPGAKSFWVGTGFRKWGLTNGTAAATILSEPIAGRELPYAHVFDSTRVGPLRGRQGADQGERQRRPALLPGPPVAARRALAGDLAPGEGGTVRVGAKKVGAYRDDDGDAARGLDRLHAPGLRGRLERRGDVVGLPVPRLALPLGRHGARRARRSRTWKPQLADDGDRTPS